LERVDSTKSGRGYSVTASCSCRSTALTLHHGGATNLAFLRAADILRADLIPCRAIAESVFLWEEGSGDPNAVSAHRCAVRKLVAGANRHKCGVAHEREPVS
jgi:hypothetical protein